MERLLCLTIMVSVFHTGHCSKMAMPAAAMDAMQSGVRLEVVTARTAEVLQEAEDSTQIQLRASFTAEETKGGVSLYDCKALSEDGAKELQLTDSEGCPTKMSPMGCMVEGMNGTVVSPVFQLSSLADAGHVDITCCWEICMTPHDLKCMDRCDFYRERHVHGKPKTDMMMHKSRRHRRDADDVRTSTPRRYVSTTIRVLPSHVRRAPHHHHAHGHHGNGYTEAPFLRGSAPDDAGFHGETVVMRESTPLLYLNPITCSVFLLVLVVFLGLYVSFIRSLRQSVDDIKREIEIQRSRDKFLVH